MRYSKKHLFLSLLLPIQVLVVQFLSQKSHLIEHYYSNGLYPYISSAFRLILGWIPFSFGDALGLVLLFLLLKAIYKLIITKGKNFIAQLLKFTSILSIIYCCFYTFWGLNYFREPLAKNLGLTQGAYTNEQLIQTTQSIVEKLNALQLQITQNDTLKVEVPYSVKEIYKLAPNGFNNMSKKLPQFAYNFSSIKSSLVSLFQSYNGTSGYINPITGEAQINDMIPKTGYPATTCHEMGHQIGWSAENDANFVSFLACTHNSDVYFQYSGYRMAYRYCIIELSKRDKTTADTIKKTVHIGIYKDFRDSYLHWKQFENPIEPYLKKGYNSYLKANNQSQGIKSYSYVVDLLIAYFEKQTL
ncbi:DUF3810 domain-containing protein [uncultured Tenacibaculum sp.]|uniref:DUF3810 domain-containing protein n=1 Tax=uncultured Tenacibaculum sp. TaxID=174713 RepID=UPI00261BC8AB|nr:DUF3810 domain-containing protein [uncultured Tenacibaculum sp.]